MRNAGGERRKNLNESEGKEKKALGWREKVKWCCHGCFKTGRVPGRDTRVSQAVNSLGKGL